MPKTPGVTLALRDVDSENALCYDIDERCRSGRLSCQHVRSVFSFVKSDTQTRSPSARWQSFTVAVPRDRAKVMEVEKGNREKSVDN